LALFRNLSAHVPRRERRPESFLDKMAALTGRDTRAPRKKMTEKVCLAKCRRNPDFVNGDVAIRGYS
jgi:hypothetical protein